MTALILLNGPPASGKSTLAAHLADRRPLTLNLDVDVIRSLFGGWIETPIDAGLAARQLALAMAACHLESGRDVVVPQFLAKIDFIHQLEAVATSVSATFVELVLDVDRQHAIQSFEARSSSPEHQTHVDATALVDRWNEVDPIGSAWDRLHAFVADRPEVQPVPVIPGDVDGTLAVVLDVLLARGVAW